MYNQPIDPTNQSRKAIIAIIIAIVVIIITISAIGIALGNQKEARIINESSYSSNSENNDNNSNVSDNNTYSTHPSQISDADLARVKKELYRVINDLNGTNDQDIDLTARWNTLRTVGEGDYYTTTFMIDVDEYQQSYEVSVDKYNVFIGCPPLGESKYPDSYCVGNNGEFSDSISVVFGSLLPYKGETAAGEGFEVRRNSLDRSDPTLLVSAYVCPSNTAALARINETIDAWIESLGASPQLFQRQVIPNNCDHLE